MQAGKAMETLVLAMSLSIPLSKFANSVDRPAGYALEIASEIFIVLLKPLYGASN